eukprot:12101648-Ditylum_brightwellii.AAC.1
MENVHAKDTYKGRMKNCLSDVQIMAANQKAKSSTFSHHFAKHFLMCDATNQTYCENINFEILNILNPIACVKIPLTMHLLLFCQPFSSPGVMIEMNK